MTIEVKREIEGGPFPSLFSVRCAVDDSEHFDNAVVAAYAAGIAAGRMAERRDCWREINKWVKHGPLPGDGTDKSAERNGLVLATNIIQARIHPENV